jgi:dTDP-4-amino-4,6-dideoxygalactose transaminase
MHKRVVELERTRVGNSLGLLERPAVVTAPPRAANIPFCKPSLGCQERDAMLRVMASGQLGGNGPVGRELEGRIQERFDVRRALLTTSCSHALEMAAMVLGLGPGDEVIMPSFGYVTSATSVVRQGARPVFAEVDETTFNLDPGDARRRITPRTRAIICVHYAGQGCDMEALMDLAEAHNLAIVEDAAQGVGARFNGRFLGSIGHVGCYSFHVTKNVVCGEGGAFLTNDPAIAGRAEIVREKGTDRSKFLRGEVDKYTWVDQGSSFVLSDLLAALALAQFSRLDEMQERRRRIWWRYQRELADLATQGHVILPHVDERAEPNWHIYAFRVSDASRRDRVLAGLKRRGIQATFHYVPLHSSPYGRRHWGCRPGDLPVTERVSASLVRLPIYPDLTLEEQDYVLSALYDVFVTLERGGRTDE